MRMMFPDDLLGYLLIRRLIQLHCQHFRWVSEDISKRLICALHEKECHLKLKLTSVRKEEKFQFRPNICLPSYYEQIYFRPFVNRHPFPDCKAENPATPVSFLGSESYWFFKCRALSSGTHEKCPFKS
ncbi:hypothetical protein TNCT_648501 [Trichonephila clavata]|uniref:Uncharacterized protein n=1 Tax=Trichonephila clavata TaxID=2740835 RepID=A0A8X6H5S1_TRICU|nr:hypothetical protein TNCT_648501 [Trichonephila clavata]